MGRFFKDFSRSTLGILMKHETKIISDQGASDGACERSWKICLVDQFLRNATDFAWSKMHQIFEKVLSANVLLNFGGPAGGSRAWKGASPPTINRCVCHMACEDGGSSSLEE